MIVDKNGKVVANISQPTIIFDTVEDYDDWKDRLPDPADEKNFLVIKNFEESVFDNLEELKNLSKSERKEDVAYKVTSLCGTLTQEVSFKYDAASDLFIPITTPVYMNDENYDEFISLMEKKQEFENYNLDIPLYEYELQLEVSVNMQDFGPFKADSLCYYKGRLFLPTDRLSDETSIDDFIDVYSRWYCRENGNSTHQKQSDTIIMHSFHKDTGSTQDYPDIIKFHINSKVATGTGKFGRRFELENYNNIFSVSSTVDDTDEVTIYPETDKAYVTLVALRVGGGYPRFI